MQCYLIRSEAVVVPQGALVVVVLQIGLMHRVCLILAIQDSCLLGVMAIPWKQSKELGLTVLYVI